MIEEDKKVVVMGKTIGAFFQFIMDDPIMMGLCIAILVLIVLFILVLFLGKKSDAKEKKEIEATKEDSLLKTEVNLNVTDIVPPTASEQPVESTVISSPEIETFSPMEAVEVPVTTEEPVKLEVPTGEPVKEVESVQDIATSPKTTVPSFDDYKIEPPTVEENATMGNIVTSNMEQFDVSSNVEDNGSIVMPMENNIFDSSVLAPESSEIHTPIEETKKEPAREENIFDNISMTLESPQIVESTVNPIDEIAIEEIPSIENTLQTPSELVAPVTMESIETPIEQPMSIEEPVAEAEIEVAGESSNEETLEDIYSFDETELPELKFEDFSRTAIIRHMPVLDTNTKNILQEDKSEDLDDLDLPKLNTTNNNSGVLNVLKGETFDIK